MAAGGRGRVAAPALALCRDAGLPLRESLLAGALPGRHAAAHRRSAQRGRSPPGRGDRRTGEASCRHPRGRTPSARAAAGRARDASQGLLRVGSRGKHGRAGQGEHVLVRGTDARDGVLRSAATTIAEGGEACGGKSLGRVDGECAGTASMNVGGEANAGSGLKT